MEVLSTKWAKSIPLTNHIIGRLFVLQNSIFRISEILLNGESGHVLITKSTNFLNRFVPILLGHLFNSTYTQC